MLKMYRRKITNRPLNQLTNVSRRVSHNKARNASLLIPTTRLQDVKYIILAHKATFEPLRLTKKPRYSSAGKAKVPVLATKILPLSFYELGRKPEPNCYKIQ